MSRFKEIDDNGEWRPAEVGCSVKYLKNGALKNSARRAREINPANRPNLRGLSRLLTPAVIRQLRKPESIAMLTTKYWGAGGARLGVSFMETTTQELRDKIIAHMNAWYDLGVNVQFFWSQSGGEVRISRGPGGYYSYMGPDILHIPSNQQTMNLEGFVLKTPLEEYKRVVRHETGHTLGFPHEHMRKEIVNLLDVNKTIAYFKASQGWSAQEVRDQVLTPLEDQEITATTADVQSIMCYQLPGSITKSGQPIPGGVDIDDQDAAFARVQYPRAAPSATTTTTTTTVSPPAPVAGGSLTLTVDPAHKTLSYMGDYTAKKVG